MIFLNLSFIIFHRIKIFQGLLIVLVVILGLVTAGLGASTYTVKDITFDKSGKRLRNGGNINNLGQVIGSNQQGHLVLWDNDELTDLGEPPHNYLMGRYNFPRINDIGSIATTGWKESGSVGYSAFRYDPGLGIQQINPPFSTSEDINNLGHITGTYSIDIYSVHAFIHDGVSKIDLYALPEHGGADGNSYGVGINNAGTVVGYSSAAGMVSWSSRGFLYKNGIMTNIGLPTDTTFYVWPRGINDYDDIIGTFRDERQGNRSFLLADGVFGDLGNTVVREINNSRQVVGIAGGATLWESGQMYDLNNLIPGYTHILLQEARSINDRGEILCVGWHAGESDAYFILTPTSHTPANNPPVADAGPNITIKSENQIHTIINGEASDPNGDALTYRWLKGVNVLKDWGNVGTNGEALLSLGTLPYFSKEKHSLVLEVSDGKTTATNEMILTIDNSAPLAAPSGGGTYQVNTRVVIGGQVSDFDGDKLSYQWLEEATVLFSGTIQVEAGGLAVQLPDKVIKSLRVGTHILTLQVSDGVNQPVSSSITIEIIDTIAPTIAPVPDKTILWPANHKMVPITIVANASDNSGGPVTLSASVASNEPQEGLGDGDTPQDWTAPTINNGVITLQLRAERSGKGSGRIYTVTIVATDGVGNSRTANVNISVPHDMGKGK